MEQEDLSKNLIISLDWQNFIFIYDILQSYFKNHKKFLHLKSPIVFPFEFFTLDN